MKSSKFKKRVTFEADKQVFTCYLESVSGNMKPFTAEVTHDKLLVKCQKKNSVKMEFNLQTIAMFESY